LSQARRPSSAVMLPGPSGRDGYPGQGGVESAAGQRAVIAPGGEVAVHGQPRRETRGQVPPGAQGGKP